MTTVVDMNDSGDCGISVPNHVEESVSIEGMKNIQSYTVVVNKKV